MAWKFQNVKGIIFGWIAANCGGVAAIGALSLILPLLTALPGWLVSLLIIGLPLGFAQWLALRRIAPVSVLWGLTISTGLPLGIKVSPILTGFFLGSMDDESVVVMTVGLATIGFIAGLVQWVFLWGHFARSWVWPFSTAAGLGLAIALVLVTNLINQSGLMSIILVTLVYATMTGFALSWLAVSPRKTERPLVETN